MTAVSTAYPTEPLLALFDPPIKLAGFRPRGHLHLDRRIDLSAIRFAACARIEVAIDGPRNCREWLLYRRLTSRAGHDQPPAQELMRQAGRHAEAQVGGALMGAAQPIFGIVMVKKKAAEVVAEVAGLPKFPDVWSMSNAAEELSKYRSIGLVRGLWWRPVRISESVI